MKPETIYANSNIKGHIEPENIPSIFVPSGRKPALPPKPPKLELKLSTRKGIVQTKCDRKSTNKKDPAEMSLKERLALFEKNKGIALLPIAPMGMSATSKQITNVSRDTTEKDIFPQKDECKFELEINTFEIYL